MWNQMHLHKPKAVLLNQQQLDDSSHTRLQRFYSHRCRVVPDAFVHLAELSRADPPHQLQRILRDFPLVFRVVRQADRVRLLELRQITAPVLDPTAEFFQILAGTAGLRKFSAKFTPKIANLAKLREKNPENLANLRQNV